MAEVRDNGVSSKQAHKYNISNGTFINFAEKTLDSEKSH